MRAPSLQFVLLLLWLALAGCGESTKPGHTKVIFPDGTKISALLRITPQEQATGMMYRTSLPKDEGMLFLHVTEEQRSYWMYQCEIPLDIIWMDRNRRIVEMAKGAPPCREVAERCPSYGGTQPSQYVLEVAAGVADAHNLRVGDVLQF
jgi:uncharacterized membrane protein (UPF0127 family)